MNKFVVFISISNYQFNILCISPMFLELLEYFLHSQHYHQNNLNPPGTNFWNAALGSYFLLTALSFATFAAPYPWIGFSVYSDIDMHSISPWIQRRRWIWWKMKLRLRLRRCHPLLCPRRRWGVPLKLFINQQISTTDSERRNCDGKFERDRGKTHKQDSYHSGPTPTHFPHPSFRIS